MSVPRRRVSRRLGACAAAALVAAVAAGARVALAGRAPAQANAGIVDIETNLAYQGAAAAGTGMVLTRAGEVLTNNHVIKGATTIKVVVPGGGRSYAATVVGYDVAADVAVLKLTRASGLRTVTRGNSAKLRVGQTVTAIGNAGGTGSLTVARGAITGLRKSITASDDEGSSEQLTGLIETNANVQPGDSGGPLLDRSRRVVGMDTAASGGFVFRAAANDAFAIPIDKALLLVKQIAAGRGSATLHVGGTAFLGVEVEAPAGGGSEASRGALVAAVVPGSPAEQAGLAAGDEITAVGGRPVVSPAAVAGLLLQRKPGDTVALTWVDGLGAQQSANVDLASGPPQ